MQNLTVKVTPEKLERGRSLANHVSVCIDCHSMRDWTKFSGPIVSGSEGKGGELFDAKMGVPGSIYSRNITPAKLFDWSDGEILRAFTEGDRYLYYSSQHHPVHGMHHCSFLCAL